MPKQEEKLTDDAQALADEITPKTEAKPDAGKPNEPAQKTDDKNKAAAGDAGKPAGADDPEIDLGGDIGKVKRSQVQAWKKAGLLEEDYRKKTDEIASQAAELKNLSDMSDFLAKHPKKLAKVLEIIQAAEDAADDAAAGAGTKKDAADAAGAAKDAIAEVLAKMDPDDPASVLLKAIYTELKSVNQRVQKFEKEAEEVRAHDKKTSEQQAVTAARGILNETLNTFAAEIKLEEEDKDVWRNLVLSALKDNPKDYASKEEFVKAVQVFAKKAHERIEKMAEARLKKYLENKGKSPALPGAGASGDGAPKKITIDNLQETVEAELEALNK